MSEASHNPSLPPWMRVFTGAAVIVLIAGPLLLFAPQVIVPYWPWAIAPFNARFLGAVYCAEFLSLPVFLIENRWSPGRASMLVAFVFTFVVSIASLIHLSVFAGVRRTALWFILYVGYATLTALALIVYRGLPQVTPLAISERFRTVMRSAGALMLIYGVLLFIIPAFAAGFWPWVLDQFHGQIYSAVFLAPGAGLLLLARSAARAEWRVGGVFNGALGLFAIAGFILAHMETGRASLSSPGTWLWLLLFAAIAALGAAMIKAARERS